MGVQDSELRRLWELVTKLIRIKRSEGCRTRSLPRTRFTTRFPAIRIAYTTFLQVFRSRVPIRVRKLRGIRMQPTESSMKAGFLCRQRTEDTGEKRSQR